MSCDRNGTRVGDTASAAAGVSPVTSKLSNVIGLMSGKLMATVNPARSAVTSRLERTAQAVSSRIEPARAAVTGRLTGAAQAVTGRVDTAKVAATGVAQAASAKTLDVIDRDGLVARAARHPLRQAAGETLLYAHRTALATGLGLAAGSGHPAGWAIAAAGVGGLYAAGRVSPDKEKGPLSVQQAPGARNSSRAVPVYQDRTNPNRRVFSLKKVNWVVSSETAAGTGRSYTRLTGKNVPRAHYYFRGPLSDEQAVGIAAGKIKAHTVPGYAGSVTDREGLSPGWAMLKHSMIRASLAQAES